MQDRPLVLIRDEDAHIYCDALARHVPELQFAASAPDSDPAAELERCEVLVSFAMHIPERAFARAKNLKWYQALGAGTDKVMADPDRSPTMYVTSGSGIHGPFLAEMAAFLMLSLARNARQLHANQHRATWQRQPGRLLKDKIVLVVGTGASGTAIRQLCEGFGMQVFAASGTPRDVPHAEKCVALDDINSVIDQVDYLVLATPYSARTRNLVNAATFKAMKPTAFLVNLSRGGIVNEADLLAALDNAQLQGAALDVFEQEPLPADHPLWQHEKVIVTPHVAGYLREYAHEILPLLKHNMRAFANKEPDHMRNVVAPG